MPGGRADVLAVVGGYAADVALGDPNRHHPVAGFGALAAAFERRLYRPYRRTGAVYTAALVLAVTAAAGSLERAADRLRGGRALAGALTLWIALGGRSLAAEGHALAALVRAGDLEAARRRLPALVGRDPDGLEPDEICRATVESIAENTLDAIVAPLVWFAAAGCAGTGGYRAANTLDAMVGHRSARYERFGWAAARLDDVLGWPVAPLAAALVVILAPAVGGDPARAWRTLRRDGDAHPSPNAGRLEAAFAGALGLRLGGRSRYDGRVEERPALGDGRPPGPDDIDRAARLSWAVGATAALVTAWARAGGAA